MPAYKENLDMGENRKMWDMTKGKIEKKTIK